MKKIILSVALVFLITAVSYTLLSGSLSKKRHFLFPNEIIGMSQNSGKEYKVVGKVSQIKEKDNLTVEFLLSDEQQTIKVVFKGILPDLMVNHQHIAVEAVWDGEILIADTIWSIFTGRWLSSAELAELKSYGLPVYP